MPFHTATYPSDSRRLLLIQTLSWNSFIGRIVGEHSVKRQLTDQFILYEVDPSLCAGAPTAATISFVFKVRPP